MRSGRERNVADKKKSRRLYIYVYIYFGNQDISLT